MCYLNRTYHVLPTRDKVGAITVQTDRVYFMDSISAEMVEAVRHGDAAKSSVGGPGSYPLVREVDAHSARSLGNARLSISAPVAWSRR